MAQKLELEPLDNVFERIRQERWKALEADATTRQYWGSLNAIHRARKRKKIERGPGMFDLMQAHFAGTAASFTLEGGDILCFPYGLESVRFKGRPWSHCGSYEYIEFEGIGCMSGRDVNSSPNRYRGVYNTQPHKKVSLWAERVV